MLLSTSGRTSQNSLSTNLEFSLAAVLITYDADPVLNCSRGTKQLLVDVFWRLLLLCATDCLLIWVLTGCSPHHIYCWSCPKCSRSTLCLLIVTCLLESVLPLWSEELSCVLSCFPKLLISVLTSHNPLFLSLTPDKVIKMLSTSQQQSNWKLMTIETKMTWVSLR